MLELNRLVGTPPCMVPYLTHPLLLVESPTQLIYKWLLLNLLLAMRYTCSLLMITWHRKAAFDSPAILKHKYLTHVVVGLGPWVVVSNKLIASCLDFLDAEAQVGAIHLDPSSLFYLPSSFH